MFLINFTNRNGLITLSATLILIGCAGGGSDWIRDAGVKASDPHLVGKRDINYDHLIVPGERIGPVGMGGSVNETVQHLGEPDTVNRSTFRGPGYNADEVYYYYNDECIQFTWEDSGVDPKIEKGLRGINVTCNKWKTWDGLQVGMPIKDVISHLGEYCASNRDDGSLIVSTKGGIWFEAANRNSLVSVIRVMPIMTSWGGMCKD
jgi:hypothetical protein